MILHLEFTTTVVITSTIFILQEHLAAVIWWLLCTLMQPPRRNYACAIVAMAKESWRLVHDGMCEPRLLLRRSGKCSSLCACEGEADKVTKGAWELPVPQQLCWHASPHYYTLHIPALATLNALNVWFRRVKMWRRRRGRGRGSLSGLIPPGWSPAPSGSRVRRWALKQSRRHLDMVAIAQCGVHISAQ